MSDVPDVSECSADCSTQRRPVKKVTVPFVPAGGSSLSILAAQSPFANYPESSLPFPLNLPPSYTTVYRDTVSAPLQRQASTTFSQSASSTPSRGGKNVVHTPASNSSTARSITTSSAVKGKRTLDAFMQSRHSAQSQTESSGSDSDTSLRKVLVNRLPGLQSNESARVLSSSPPSSSPVLTPRESSPVHPTLSGSLIGFSPSPSPRPKRRATINARAGPSSSSSSTLVNDLPYTLPSGPYPEERPAWSLAALIGQSINASFAGALPLNDIYTYISTVYPYFDRRDQAWMSSIRHSLSVNEAFERVYDQDGTAAKKVKCKGKTRLKGGFWRIRPGYEDCFMGGNFVRKGAKGAGPGMNPSSKKRAREEEDPQRSQKARTASRAIAHIRSNSNLETTAIERKTSRMRSQSSPQPIFRQSSPLRCSSPPFLTTSQSTYPSDNLPSDPFDDTPVPSESLDCQRKLFKDPHCEPVNILAKLEASFELQSSPEISDFERPRKIITPLDILSNRPPSSSSSFPSHSLPSRPSTPSRCKTPPPRALTPSRTPISYKGIQMSPTISLAHYKNSLEPEWKVTVQPSTPIGGNKAAPFATPQRLLFPRPARSPSKYYDPYDPETILADELAIMSKSRELGESPGGIFGKEGRKLLYESPSVPGKSDWRFPHDEL